MILTGLAGTARTRAIHAYFVNRDLASCKQNCYLATKLSLASVGQDGGTDFGTWLNIFYALLSDNRDIINSIAQVETLRLAQEKHKPTSIEFSTHMLQLAILGDDSALHQKIEIAAKKGAKRKRQEFSTGQDFFSLLLKRDKAGLEDLIKNHHVNIKNNDPITEDFLSFNGTLEVKLCWYRGIPVEIEHPLVPMQLMPIQTLAHYDDVYEFLKPGWVPPRQGSVANLMRWFSKKIGPRSV